MHRTFTSKFNHGCLHFAVLKALFSVLKKKEPSRHKMRFLRSWKKKKRRSRRNIFLKIKHSVKATVLHVIYTIKLFIILKGIAWLLLLTNTVMQVRSLSWSAVVTSFSFVGLVLSGKLKRGAQLFWFKILNFRGKHCSPF